MCVYRRKHIYYTSEPPFPSRKPALGMITTKDRLLPESTQLVHSTRRGDVRLLGRWPAEGEHCSFLW